MHLLNLSVLELTALMSAVSALVVAIYLLNRARKRQVVATLQFWQTADRPTQTNQRRRIQQPLSLALQLISLLLLLLAIAQPRLGPRAGSARDHVLILDSSAWMAAHRGNATLMEEAKQQARRWIDSLPSTDRVMLVRADGFPAPATGFESDRDVLIKALNDTRPGANALNVEQAFAFAAQTQSLHSRSPGEVVFAGAGRSADRSSPALPKIKLRVLPVSSERLENAGIRRISLRRSSTDASAWTVFVLVRNYGSVARTIPVLLKFAGGPVATRRLTVAPGKEEESSFELRTQAHGWIEVSLVQKDALADDNLAILEVPSRQPLLVDVYTSNRAAIEPILAANVDVQARYLSPADYKGLRDARILIFDSFRPPQPPDSSNKGLAGVLYLAPPAGQSPVPVRMTTGKTKIVRWRQDHPLAAGLRARELELQSAEVFAPAAGDVPIAEVDSGPVVVSRSSPYRQVFLGFHPGRADVRFDLFTPLLFANILRWIEPGAFRTSHVFAGTVGPVDVPLSSDFSPQDVKVLAEDGSRLPFSLQGQTLHFYAGEPGTVKVITPTEEQTHSLTLPEIGESIWKPPATARRGVSTGFAERAARDLWRWFAVAGLLGLLAEWLLFGRASSRLRSGSPDFSYRAPEKAA